MTWWLLRDGRRRPRRRRRGRPLRRARDRLRHRPARRRPSPSTGWTSPWRSAATRSTPRSRPVSAVPEVRARLLELQRAVIAAEPPTAASSSRAATSAPSSCRTPRSSSTSPPTRPPAPRAGPPRRAAPTSPPPSESLLARDKIDSGRATAPLAMADGAVHIDTTPYSLDEVIDQVVALVEDGRGARRDRLRTSSDPAATRSSTRAARPAPPAAPGRAVADPAPVRRPRARRRAGARRGPVIFAANHVGVIDGPLLAICAPAAGARADQAGDVRGPLGWFLLARRPGPAGPVPRRPARGEDLPAGAAGRASGRHLPRGQPRRRATSSGSTAARPTSRWSRARPSYP